MGEVWEVERALTPKLTRFDKRVLRALEPQPKDWPEWLREGKSPPWRNAWAIAEKLGEDDVRLVRGTLLGLTHLGYALCRNAGPRAEWMRRERGTEAMDAARGGER